MSALRYLTRPNSIHVDLGALYSNVRAVRRAVGPHVHVIAAVKADGYGFGLPQVAHAALQGGAEALGVADPQDVMRIRRDGIDAPILLYGGILPNHEAAMFAREFRVTVALSSADDARALSASRRQPTRACVEVDVGLERLGVNVDQAVAEIKTISRMDGIHVVGISTHLHGSDVGEYIDWQFEQFDEVLDGVARDGIEVEIRLAESSATIGGAWRNRLNAVDPGHLLYGLIPRGRSDRPEWLRPVLTAVASRLILVKRLVRDEYRTEAPVAGAADMWIGIIPLGIADGLSAICSGEVLVRGHRVPLVGAWSLEHARVDLSEVPDARTGDEVILIGRQGPAEITAEEVQRANGLPPAGLVAGVDKGVARVYNTAGRSRPSSRQTLIDQRSAPRGRFGWWASGQAGRV